MDTESILKTLLHEVACFVRDGAVAILPLSDPENITIDAIEFFLKEHFMYNYGTHGGSKLPVIALHSVMQIVVAEVGRYTGCTLKDLGSHTASDRISRSCGDIEIFKENTVFEVIEVKHNKAIESHIVRLAQDKIYTYNPERYYILSNAVIENEKECQAIIDEVRIKHGCHIILNGILPTITYYLRLIQSPESFVNIYLKMVEGDTELQAIHKQRCNDLLQRFKI